MRAVHVEAADAGQPHHLARRQGADDRVALLAPRPQGVEDRLEMLLEEEHRRDDDVGAGDVGAAARERARIGAPLRGHMDRQGEPWQIRGEPARGALDRTGQVRVHRHDDDPHGRGVSGRNALWHRTAFRR
mgnify:CR=1 FL=1